MTRLKRAAVVSIVGIVGIFGVELGAGLGVPGIRSMIGDAEAIVGRPLTPVSYAGVARRSSRRVARRTAYRISTLPVGCVYGPYHGASYYNCGGTYYAPEGNTYVQVVFD